MLAGKSVCDGSLGKAHKPCYVSLATYRRSRTQKAPRKRQQLLLFSKNSAGGLCALTGAGSNGGGNFGGGDGNRGRWGGNDFNSNGWNPSSFSMFPGSMALLLASVALVSAVQAGPAFAEATAPLAEEALALLVDSAIAPAAITDGGAMFQTLPQSYSLTALTEEEKELVCPRQYRPRETVYVH